MWQRSYECTVQDVNEEQIWETWADINRWHEWDVAIEYARTSSPFEVGSRFRLKPKGGPAVSIEIVECAPKRHFVDLTRFPFARMYGRHEMCRDVEGRLTLKTTMSVEGLLGFFWRRLVAQKIVDDLPIDTEKLIEAARKRQV